MSIQPDQRQAQADRDACDRLLKAIFDRGLGQRQIARVTGIPLSTVQRALQRVIYPYRQDRPIEDAPAWKKRRAKLESLAIDQLQPTAGTKLAKAEPTESELKKAMDRAKMAIDPSVKAANVIAQFSGHDLAPLAVQLQIGMNAINKNDLRECEAMLYCQTHALQAIFTELARQAVLQVKEEGWFPNYEAHTRLALKAQSQCRATIGTLAAIKNPPVVVARQANIAQGPQQVNNEMMRAAEPRAPEDVPNKLLEEKPHERLDFGAPGAAVGADAAMATLGTLDRAEVRRR